MELYKFCVSLQNSFAGDLTRIFSSAQGTTIGEIAVFILRAVFRLGTPSEPVLKLLFFLPSNIVLVISQADIRDTFSVQSYLLRNKYAVSLLHSDPLEEVLQILHANRAKKYTNSTIDATFTQSFIYSFVYDKDALAQILKHGVSMVIIPESLVDQVDCSIFECSVFIDNGF